MRVGRELRKGEGTECHLNGALELQRQCEEAGQRLGKKEQEEESQGSSLKLPFSTAENSRLFSRAIQSLFDSLGPCGLNLLWFQSLPQATHRRVQGEGK